jgi:hypothetical protein
MAMKSGLDDKAIERLVRDLRDEPAPDPAWVARAWMGIEARLGRPERFLASRWRGVPLRWAAVSACLLVGLGLGLNQRSRRGAEVDLGAYVSTVARPSVEADRDEIAEPFLVSEAAGFEKAGWTEDEEPETTIYDTMLEL